MDKTKTAKSKFWNFVDNDGNAELLIYGPIAENTWWGDEVTPRKFQRDLASLGVRDEIVVRINSGGGDVFAANAIYTALRDNAARIHVKIDGLAASAASIIAMAGDVISMPKNAFMMIHNPTTFALGEAKDLQDVIEFLGIIKENIIETYSERTGKDKKEISDMMDAETWFTGEQAVAEGFADELLFGSTKISITDASSVMFNGVACSIDKYRNFPDLGVIGLLSSDGVVGGSLPLGGGSGGRNKEVSDMEIKTIEHVREHLPKVYDAILAEGKKAERERLSAIDEIAEGIAPELVAEAKYKNFTDAAALALAAVKGGGISNATYLGGLDKDANTANAVVGSTPPLASATVEDNKKKTLVTENVSKIVKNMFKRGEK